MMPDPAHIIKSIRKHGFTYEPKVHKKFVKRWGLKTDIVKFQYIKDLIEFQEDKELQLAPHLSKAECVDLGKYASMKVGPAVNVCSRETGSALEFMVEHHGMDEEALITAKFCHMVGRWYAYMSGRNLAMAFLSNNPHKNKTIIEFLQDFCEFILTLKVHSKQKKLWLFQKTVYISTLSLIWLVKKLIDGKLLKVFMGCRTLGDVVENLHTLVRSVNPCPTALLYKRVIKGIGISQFLGSGVRKGSYGQDTSTEQLIDFDHVKALCLEKKEESKEDDYFLDTVCTSNDVDFADIATLALVGGYFLKKVINSPSSKRRKAFKCIECCSIWIQKASDENQLENSFIDHKEFKKGAFTRPSILGNQAFFSMEALFIINRDTYRSKKGISMLIVRNIVGKLSDQFNDIFPKCHLEKIVKKYVNCRLQRWGKFENMRLTSKNKEVIYGDAYASPSTAARVILT